MGQLIIPSMKNLIQTCVIAIMIANLFCPGNAGAQHIINPKTSLIQNNSNDKANLSTNKSDIEDKVAELKTLLNKLVNESDDIYFKNHCKSIIDVIEAKGTLTNYDTALLNRLYATFADTTVSYNASLLSSYLNRKRPFIISWTSPTDGVVSLAWLIPPENWDYKQSYPLYIRLHGLADVYTNPIEYMTYYLKPETLVNTTFEDGYNFLPWGRGNLWYNGIGETDIWEGLDFLESNVKVDQTKKYLVGMSMGGYGTWYIGQKSADTWAALGIYAGALSYPDNSLVNATVAQKLKDVPVYFVCGTSDGLLGINQTAYKLLQDAGNENLAFATFPGGHESILENWIPMYEWIRNFTNDRQGNEIVNYQTESQNNLITNYPNPFNNLTNIHLNVPKDRNVKLEIFNITGQKVRTLLNCLNSSDNQIIQWDGRDDYGYVLSNGVYFCNLHSAEHNISLKIFLIR